MECHDVQQLLAFVNRPSEELDAAERESLREHLATCPDCAARLQADRRADEVFGPLMRNVAVPADLKAKVLKRLSTERPRPWLTWVAAAAVMLVVVGALAWLYRPNPSIDLEYLDRMRAVEQWNEESIEDYFNKQGTAVKVPRQMEYRFLQHLHIVEMEGRRVAKLSFSTRLQNPGANAEVFIFPKQQLRMDDLKIGKYPGTTSIWIWHETDYPDFVFVAFYRGDINLLTRIPAT